MTLGPIITLVHEKSTNISYCCFLGIDTYGCGSEGKSEKLFAVSKIYKQLISPFVLHRKIFMKKENNL